MKRRYLDGKLHREDGPAVEHGSGMKRRYLDGRLHREDGPAIVRGDGTLRWFLNGEEQAAPTGHADRASLAAERFGERLASRDATLVLH